MKNKASLSVWKAGLAGVLLSIFASNSAAANVYVVIDKTFDVTTHGAQVKELGKNWHQVVAFHKVVRVKDKAYACVGYLGDVPRKEFLHKSKLYSGDALVKKQLGGATWLVNEPKVAAERKRSKIGLLGAVAAPADINLVTGSKIKCLKGGKWQDGFASQASRLEIPESVMVRQ
ncbi:hypothetical protein [Ruegeria jejuensis]|uniref:hypothetical protein n=1 Tax=Ruegeria jejuensis TaxID=3233338 RepID=UPI00355C052F